MTDNRIAAAALAALGAASAIPIPLAQLDFAGVWNVFNIDSGDSPRALQVIMGVGGVLTIAVLALAFVGAALAASGHPAARPVLVAAALAGLVTAMPLWIPAGVVIGAAAVLLGQPQRRDDALPAHPTSLPASPDNKENRDASDRSAALASFSSGRSSLP
jgi:hypothetical protein